MANALNPDKCSMSLHAWCLIHLSANPFSAYALHASFEHDVTELNECRIHSIIDDIDWTFNDLYREARQEKKILMPLCVRNSVLDYYRQFDIDFDADENGVHIIVL